MTSLALTESRIRSFLALTKPRVVSLIVFCAVIGMFLATPDFPRAGVVFFATVGIALVAGAAAAVNCLVEQKIDARMARTRRRPLPSGELTSMQTLVFACLLGGVGLLLLYRHVNALTMWLTLATFVGYAVVYTVVLKPATPQNIVIGGASGAMPPVLGWAAVTGEISPEPLILFLIIFLWTPPHFWALALNRGDEYARAGVPMLPVVAGRAATTRQILIYSALLAPISVLPCLLGFAGPIYGATAVVCGGIFVALAFQLHRSSSVDRKAAHRLFAFSIAYLFLLFAALLIGSVGNRGSSTPSWRAASVCSEPAQAEVFRSALGTACNSTSASADEA